MSVSPSKLRPTFRASGFTAIEAIVTLALLAIVFVMLAPFAQSWLCKARVAEAQSVLQKAVVLARQAATDSALPLSHAAPVSVICLNGGQLQVRRVTQDIDFDSGQKPCEHSVLLWQTELNAEVETQYMNDQQFPVLLSEIHFNSQGQLVSDFCQFAGAKEHCATGNRLVVSAGSAQLAGAITL